MAGPIALEAIVSGIELMELCPLPALQSIARTLINIWQAVELVGVRLGPYTPTFFIIIDGTDEPPCYTSRNSNVHNHSECRS